MERAFGLVDGDCSGDIRLQADQEHVVVAMTLTLMLLLAGPKATEAAFDCSKAEREVAERIYTMRAQTERNQKYGIGWKLQEFVRQAHVVAPGCATDRILPMLIDLVGDADVDLAANAARSIGVFRGDAMGALPALRAALPKAKAADAAAPPKTGWPREIDYVDYFNDAISGIESARVLPPRWESGFCVRWEGSEIEGEPESGIQDLRLRVAREPMDSLHCTPDAMTRAATWEFESDDLKIDSVGLPPRLVESLERLDRFKKTGVTVGQICPDLRSALPAGLRLSDMRLDFMNPQKSGPLFFADFESHDAKIGRYVQIEIGFDPTREIRVNELDVNSCEMNESSWRY